MRTFGYGISVDLTATVRGVKRVFAVLALLLGAAVLPSMQAQTAPYVLPYNMTTFAGPNAQYTVGASCSPNSSLIALDIDGDGCLATQASVNIDPHDIRVDSQGFVYIVDDGASNAVVHRINPYSGLYTIYYGSAAQTKECTTPTGAATTTGAGDGAGDGCIASDSLANSTTTYFTYYPGSNIRGLGLSPSNDLFLSDYTLDSVQKIAGTISGSVSTNFGHLATGIAGKVSAGKGSSGTANGTYGTSQLKSNRGASADAAGTVYIADSGNNLIRKVVGGTATTSGTSSTVSATNTTPTYITGTTGNNVSLSSATFVGPEDAQVDIYGNLIIADFGDNLVRAVYHYAAASTTATQSSFFGITSGLVAGNVYTIAGTGAPPKVSSTCTLATTGTTNASAYAGFTFTANGISNSLPGTTVPLQVRKLGLDAQGNVYIADGCDGVVYFLDAQTGGMHVIAGIYGQGQTAPTMANATGVCSAATDFVGDGCPGTQASLDPTNMATQPDTQGNLFITDSEGGTSAALARIRKLTNGLNFGSTTVGSSVTQGVLIHFAKGDVPATSNAFVVPSSDFSVSGTPSCNTNTATDNTTDCVVALKYTPTRPGFETSTLTATSKLGGTVTYRISGVGSTPELAYDPGNATLLNGLVSAAQSVVVDGQGNAYLVDAANRLLLYTASSGALSVLVPAGTLNNPKAVALGTDGSVYIADTGNNLIRKYSGGTLTTVGGGGTVPAPNSICYTGSGAISTDSLGDGCPATNASFSGPSGLAVDSLGNVFVADTGNKIIRVISTNGYITQLLTNFTTSAGNSSPFAAPAGLALDVVNSNLLVADKTNSSVYSINLNTTYTTPLTNPSTIVTNPVKVVVGTGAPGSNVGAGGAVANTQLNAPTGVAVDASGNVYVADSGNSAIRLVTPGGTVSTIAGILATSGTGTIGSTATITGYSYTTNSTTNVTTVTLTANNSFTAGTNVTLTGLTTLTFLNNQNLSVQSGPTATQFQVEYAGTISNPPPASGSETGTASSSSLATSTQLNSPAAVAVTPLGNLIIADTGNSRLLYDSRSQVSFNFGRVNLNSNSSPQTFTAVNVGNSAASLNGLTTNPSSSTFSLTGCSVGTLTLGSTCALTGQFSPTAAGLQTATYSDTSGSPNYTPLLPSNPSITLIGTGAALTPTSISVVQTVPATGNPQFGAPVTLQATITAGTCNLFAPSCVPSGTVTFSIDGVAGAGIATSAGATSATASESPTGLSVGQHTITCTFTPDSTDNAYYAPSSCPSAPGSALIVTVTQGGSMSVLSYPVGANNQPQFTPVTLSATVTSVPPSGVPTGSVTFYSDAAMQNAIGTGTVNPTTGVATLSLYTTTDKNGNVLFNNTLVPGTYTLTCQYNPTPPASTANYTGSTCAGVSFTVTGDAASLTLNPIPCSPSQIYQAGTSTPLQGLPCPSLAPSAGGLPTVATAQGSTTDVTLFVTPSNTVSGTLSFSCSGLPANSVCTFSPQTLTVTAGTAYPQPLYTDVTLWTDIPPGVTPTKSELKLPGHGGDGTMLALMLGWPLTLLGFVGLLRFRKTGRMRALTLTALGMLMVGSALTLSGCAGPGIYHPNLTPTGTSTVTITVTGPNVSQSTVVSFTVTQGVAGQQ